jgi:hypothetical protein
MACDHYTFLFLCTSAATMRVFAVRISSKLSLKSRDIRLMDLQCSQDWLQRYYRLEDTKSTTQLSRSDELCFSDITSLA